MKELIKRLALIQEKLVAQKGSFNSFGKYAYRSCEDILEAVKPHLKGLVLTLEDEIVLVGERFYLKATASITDGEHIISKFAYAREAEDKKGMDVAQVTGAASSYSRKYALNGLFCIDDNKDPDVGPPPDEKFENVKKHQEYVRKHFESISSVKSNLQDHIDEKVDLSYAMESWYEIPKDDRKWLMLAPSKGGVFTTVEGKVIQGPEFKARLLELLKSGDEPRDMVDQ